MKDHVKIFITILILVFFFQKVAANAAQPGVWNAGGTIFTMMYPKDSATFKKVQMQEEKIYMQLYPGFAVVKGWYRMTNTTDKKLNFKMGYPINGIYSGGGTELNEVQMDSLTQFKIYSNKIELPLIKTKWDAEQNTKMKAFGENWLVWDMSFLPEESKIIEVYFIVETNNGAVRKGYSRDSYNAFIYLLESGSVWKNPIVQGSFYIQLMQGLQEKNIHGISEGFGFLWSTDNTMAKGFKSNFSPNQKDNLIITYSQRDENFNFSSIILRKDQLFAEIDLFSKNIEQQKFTEKKNFKDPYSTSPTVFGSIVDFALIFIFLIPVILGGILVFFIARYMIKKRKRKNK